MLIGKLPFFCHDSAPLRRRVLCKEVYAVRPELICKMNLICFPLLLQCNESFHGES